MAKLKILCYL